MQLTQRGLNVTEAQLGALHQRVPLAIQPAQLLAYHRGATAQHARRVEASRRGQVSARAVERLHEIQGLTLAQPETAPRLERLTIHGGGQVCTRQRQCAIALGDDAKTAQGDFNHRRLQPIAQQPVGPRHRLPVGSAALRHAQVPNTKTSGVLQLAQRGAGLNQQSAHAKASCGVSSPPRRMNSL